MSSPSPEVREQRPDTMETAEGHPSPGSLCRKRRVLAM